MQDHEFEKQVSQKMADLNLQPSETVWEKVDAEIHRKEKRRRWILLLPFILGGLLLAGYSTYKLRHKQFPAAIEKPGTLSTSVGGKKKSATSPVDTRGASDQSKKQDHDLTPEVQYSPLQKQPYKTARINTPTQKIRNTAAVKSEAAVILNNGRQTITASSEDTPARNEIQSNNRPEPGNKSKSADADNGFIKDREGINATESRESILKPAEVRYNHERTPGVHILPGILKASSTINSPFKIANKTSRWEWGITLQAGKTSVTSGDVGKLFPGGALSSPGNNFATNGNPYIPPSPIRAGFGFSPGIFVARRISRTTEITAGLGYALYSTSQMIGKRIDSVIVVAPLTPADSRAVESFSGTGRLQTFTNRYHFVELPVSLRTKLFSKKKTSLNWSVGFTLSRLVGANALQFDNTSRIYYKDNRLFNKTYVQVATGMDMRVVSAKKYALYAGPLLRYNITNLLPGGTNGNQHLLFIGLKTDIRLYKNK